MGYIGSIHRELFISHLLTNKNLGNDVSNKSQKLKY